MSNHSTRPIGRLGPFGLALILATACGATTEEFVPVSAADRPGGPPAAYYDVKVEGERQGMVRVWSPAVYPATRVTGDVGVIHVLLRITNDSVQPMQLRLDRTALEINTSSREFLPLDKPARVDGQLTVPPGETRRIGLWYRLPKNVWPSQVESFELAWALEAGDQVYAQVTPFMQRWEAASTVYYSPWYPYYYDPFWGPTWY